MTVIISNTLFKLLQTSAWNTKLRLQRTQPRLCAACGLIVTSFFISLMEVLISDISIFFIYLKQKSFHRELISIHSQESGLQGSFLFNDVTGFTHINGKWKKNYSASTSELFKSPKMLYKRISSSRSALSWDSLSMHLLKSIKRTKFWSFIH